MERALLLPSTMMTTTHAVVGALVGGATAAVGPVPTTTALVVGFVGGTLPDADLVATHRRSLHFPVYASVATVLAAFVAAVVATPATMLVVVFLVAFAVHCLMDVFGGGVEVRPWEATSDRGVYDHYGDRWIAPRRWVRYAGAPEDLLVATAAGLPVLAVATGGTRTVLAVVLTVSAGFTVFRRRLAGVSERLFADGADG